MATGIVTKHLFELITKQVEENRLVVWYDPEQAYLPVVESLDVSDTEIIRYDGSFFQLRHDIDRLLNGEQPPRLVVYVPVDRAKTRDALLELDVMGAVMQPGQQPPQRNTRLAIVARNALRPIVGDETASEVEKQVDSGKLTLADVNALAEKGKDISTGVVSLVFGTANPEEIAIHFLHNDKYDEEVEKRAAKKELVELLNHAFEVDASTRASLSTTRDKLAPHVLVTDLIHGLGDQVPSALESVSIPSITLAIDNCVNVARNWRLRRDVRQSYVAAADEVEKKLSLSSLHFDPDKIVGIETFLAIERALIRHVENALLESADEKLLTLAQSRLSCFWSDVMALIQAHWALITSAAHVLLEADRIEKALKKAPSEVPELLSAYAEGDSAWCLLDMHHRHMETRWHNFDPSEEHEGLEKLIAKARHRYNEVGSQLAKHFVTQFDKAKEPRKGSLSQVAVFETQVKPKLGEGKIAYVWVDALRFEMARELCDVLKDDFDLAIQPAIGTIPTITEIGMAALLPKAHQSAKVVSIGSGKLALEVGGTVIKNRSDRIAFLEANVEVPVFATKLDDLLPKPKKKVREGIEGAQLILVTSQEIDTLGEEGNITQARRQMDGVLTDLRRGFRVLVDHGVKSIVMAADHGHWFAEEVGEDMKIDPPGGDTADLHRRVWLGVGGTSEPSYLRTSLASLGVDSDLDVATPWTFGVFRQKGKTARAYFHGGMSPQELIIPVVSMTPAAQKAVATSVITWKLSTGTPKLTTRFLSVRIDGNESGLFEGELPKVCVEIRVKRKCISRPVSASYGFEDATGEVQLRTKEGDPRTIESNTVAVMVIEEISQETVSLHLVDATSGAELAKIDRLEVAISI